jgi:DNA-binding MarR family transcriptional regulator
MKKGRFARIPEHALKANLSLQAYRVLIAIALHAGPDCWAWPSLSTIDALTGLQRSDTCAAIDQLEKAGVLRRESSKGGRSNPTRYRIVGMPEKTGPNQTPFFL